MRACLPACACLTLDPRPLALDPRPRIPPQANGYHLTPPPPLPPRRLKLNGYHFGPEFSLIQKQASDEKSGLIKWNMNWISFFDGLLQLSGWDKLGYSLRLPIFIRRITCFAPAGGYGGWMGGKGGAPRLSWSHLITLPCLSRSQHPP